MPYQNTSGGLVLTVPTKGTKNWDSKVMDENFEKISSHQHTGADDGSPIGGSGIEDDGIDDTKIRLSNDGWLRARNAAGTADVNILKVNTSNEVELGVVSVVTGQITTDLSSSDVTVDSGKSLFHPNLIIDSLKTYLVEGSLFSLSALTVNGTLTVNGVARVI